MAAFNVRCRADHAAQCCSVRESRHCDIPSTAFGATVYALLQQVQWKQINISKSVD